MSGDRLNLPRMVAQITEIGTYYSLLGKWGAFFSAIAVLVGLAVNHIIKNGFGIIPILLQAFANLDGKD